MLRTISKWFSSNSSRSEETSIGAVAADEGQTAASIFEQASEAFQKDDQVRALDLYAKVVERDPEFVRARVMLGFLYKQRGNLVFAKNQLTEALALDSELSDANYLLGSIAASENDGQKMRSHFRRSLDLAPQQEHLYLEFSFGLFQLGYIDDAIHIIQEGLQQYPQHVGLLQYLGNINLSAHRPKEALVAYKAALEFMPDSVDLLYNFVMCCMALFDYEQALDTLLRIQKLQPNHIMANFEESMLRLQKGEYERGWKQFEWRWQIPSFAASKLNTTKPKWDGTQSLQGKTILIRSEQGLGDTIQFSRLIPRLKDYGAYVIFSTSKPLLELMQQIDGIDSLVDESQETPNFDFYCELMSLPLALNLTINTINSASGYLVCPSDSKARWEPVVRQQGRKFKVGVVWSGNPKHTNNHMRSIPFEAITTLFEADADFTILQKELSSAERAELSQYKNVFFYGDDVFSFSDTAGLVEQMDLVITVDTSVAHLAGAMAKNTWILISYFSDWRWHLQTQQSPWYDSVTLYRQKVGNHWDTLISEVKAQLNVLCE
jgi:tetratricopeptide (TPR) repeat protein